MQITMAQYVVDAAMNSEHPCSGFDLVGSEYVSSGEVTIGNITFDLLTLPDNTVIMHARTLGAYIFSNPWEWALDEHEFDGFYDVFRSKFTIARNESYTGNVNDSWTVLKDRVSHLDDWLKQLDSEIDTSKYRLRNITR